MNPTASHDEKLSEYSFLPFSHVEEAHFKLLLDDYKSARSSPEELSDAYESLGLSQLLDGDYVEAATNLECACTIQDDTLKGGNDEKIEHRLRTKFWCAVAFMRIGQLEKAESFFTYIIQNVKRKKWDIYAAANSNMALVMVQLNKRKDLTTKFARAGLDAAARVYKHETLEYMHHLRVLLYTLMFFNDYNQVETNMDEAKGFPALERALFQAGISFAKGRLEDAGVILSKALHGVEYEQAVEFDEQSVEPALRGNRGVSEEKAGTPKETGGSGAAGYDGPADEQVVTVTFKDGTVDMNALGLSASRLPRKIDYISVATSVHDLICYALIKYNLTVLVAHKMQAAGGGEGLTSKAAAHRASLAMVQRAASINGLSIGAGPDVLVERSLYALDAVDVPSCMRDAADALERSCLMVKREMAERYHTPYNCYVEEHSQIVAKPSIRQHDGHGFYDVATLPQLMLSHVLAAQGEWEVTHAVLLKAVRFQRAAFLKESPKGAAGRPGTGSRVGTAGAGAMDDDTLSEASASVSARAPTLETGAGVADEVSGTVRMREEAEEELVLVSALKRFEAAAASMSSGLSGHASAIALLKRVRDDDDDLSSVESSDSVLSLGSGRYYKSRKFGRSKRVIGQSIVSPESAATAAAMLAQKPKQHAADIETAVSLLDPVSFSLDELATATTNKDVALVADLVGAYRSLRLMARGDDLSTLAVAQDTTAALAAMGVVLSNATGHVKTKKKAVKPNRYPSGHVREHRYMVAAVDPMRDEERPFTVKHEVLPFTKRHGRSVVSAYVQWALSVTGGIGYGFMGLGSPSSLQQGLEMTCMSTEKGLLLYEVYARLASLEAAFRKEDADSTVNRLPYRVEEQRNRFLLNAVMAKVAVQLGLKDECARAVSTLQKLIKDLRRNNKPPVSEAALSAVALRFQLDWEQLSLPLASTFTSRIHLLMDTIVKCKEYLGYAERSKDVHLQRDALRRIMNALVEVGQMSQLAREDEESTKVDGAAATAHKKPNTAASQSAKPEELLKWSPKDMEALEVQDEQWVARYGRLRALHYLDRLRALATVEEGEEGVGGQFMPARPGSSSRFARKPLSPYSQVGRIDDDEDDAMGDATGGDTEEQEDEEDDDDADSDVDEEEEHDASLRYAREHTAEWDLPLERYQALTSTRAKSDMMALSGGTFFIDQARKRMEVFESEDRVSGGGTMTTAKSFREFFEFATPLGGDAEQEVDEGEGEDSDPETKWQREDAQRVEDAQHIRDDPSQDPTKKKTGVGKLSKSGSQRAIKSVRDRPRTKSKKRVTIASDGDEEAPAPAPADESQDGQGGNPSVSAPSGADAEAEETSENTEKKSKSKSAKASKN